MIRRDPLWWVPNRDGEGFKAVWYVRRGDLKAEEFLIEPHLFRTYSRAKEDYVEEAWIGWTLTWRDQWIQTERIEFFFGDSYDSPVFTLNGALRIAEQVCYHNQQASKKLRAIRRILGLERLSHSWFKWWLTRHYPIPRAVLAWKERSVKQWQDMVGSEAKRRLELEGREPVKINTY